MSPTTLQEKLLKLNQNLNILREREARHAGNAPLELLNQIDDHQAAITLTGQALAGELDEAHYREALKPLLVEIKERTGEAQVTIGDVGRDIINSTIAGRDVVIYTGFWIRCFRSEKIISHAGSGLIGGGFLQDRC